MLLPKRTMGCRFLSFPLIKDGPLHRMLKEIRNEALNPFSLAFVQFNQFFSWLPLHSSGSVRNLLKWQALPATENCPSFPTFYNFPTDWNNESNLGAALQCRPSKKTNVQYDFCYTPFPLYVPCKLLQGSFEIFPLPASQWEVSPS